MMQAIKTGSKLLSATRNVYARNQFFSASSILRTNSPNTVPEKDSKDAPVTDPNKPLEMRRPLSNFDRKVLVWSGKYKSAEDIPDNVAHDTLDRARDRARVKACIYMSIATAIGCFVMVISGKRAAKRGESVTKSNIEWHREYNEAAVAKERINKGI